LPSWSGRPAPQCRLFRNEKEYARWTESRHRCNSWDRLSSSSLSAARCRWPELNRGRHSPKTKTSFPEDESEIKDVYVLPDIPLSRFQNELLPEHAIADDRGMMLGGIGSDLWHGSGDDQDEFWGVTDRGPNDEIKVKVGGEKETRRTFPVPEFTPSSST
jgi:hypothetical protein